MHVTGDIGPSATVGAGNFSNAHFLAGSTHAWFAPQLSCPDSNRNSNSIRTARRLPPGPGSERARDGAASAPRQDERPSTRRLEVGEQASERARRVKGPSQQSKAGAGPRQHTFSRTAPHRHGTLSSLRARSLDHPSSQAAAVCAPGPSLARPPFALPTPPQQQARPSPASSRSTTPPAAAGAQPRHPPGLAS